MKVNSNKEGKQQEQRQKKCNESHKKTAMKISNKDSDENKVARGNSEKSKVMTKSE